MIRGDDGGRGVGQFDAIDSEMRTDEDVVDPHEGLQRDEGGARLVIFGGVLDIAQAGLQFPVGLGARSGIEIAAENDGFIGGDVSEPAFAEDFVRLAALLVSAEAEVGVDQVEGSPSFELELNPDRTARLAEESPIGSAEVGDFDHLEGVF